MRLVTVDCATYMRSAVRVKFFNFESIKKVRIPSEFMARLPLPAARGRQFKFPIISIKIIYFINRLQIIALVL